MSVGIFVKSPGEIKQDDGRHLSSEQAAYTLSRLSLLQDLLSSFSERSLGIFGPGDDAIADADTLIDWCDTLLTSKGEASGVVRAQRILDGFRALEDEPRLEFYRALANRYQPDPTTVKAVSAAYAKEQSPETLKRLIKAVVPKRQQLFRRLNLAPNGTATLVTLREGLFPHLEAEPELKVVDFDLKHMFGSWFNRGFLVLGKIDWNTSARLLEKIIRYEAVHEINGWDDLRRRVNPSDRRCFAFFHPSLENDPLIFVEVALTRDTPATISELLDENREPDAAEQASTGVFYSISNCQPGLRGVSFGHFLIKQVAYELMQELPRLKRFVTLSPVPGLLDWLRSHNDEALAENTRSALALIDHPGWQHDPEINKAAQKLLLPLAAHYLINEKHKGMPLDPVARFHIGNGSSLDRINWGADLSERALDQSAGIMVNYQYDLDHIERNHESCVEKGLVTASRNVRNLLKDA